jgi:L-ascorbate metabolism protein UlaG (beta-lactamase superfamily)
MRIQWFGQSAFLLSAGGTAIFIDPFGRMDAAAARGMRWDYPPIEGVRADLLLVTHEHGDHNEVEAIDGAPPIIRSTAGTLESPIGKITAVASEHDQAAGTQRGPNTIFVFEFDGLRTAHFGDFGQTALRSEQRRAIGEVDLLFLPVGGMATIDGAAAAVIAHELQPRWIVPMHYRTEAISFLEPADGFFAAMEGTEMRRLAEPTFTTDEPSLSGKPAIVIPAVPTTRSR